MSNIENTDGPDALPRNEAAATEWKHPTDNFARGFVLDNRASLGTLGVFVAMMVVFTIANPTVFTTWYLYSSVLTTLPVAIFMASLNNC